MSKYFAPIAMLLTLAFIAGCRTESGGGLKPPDEPLINRSGHKDVALVLDALHDAASKADEPRYFALFADDAIFYGTDDTERWTVDQFRAYAHPYFSKGQGWTYTVADRFIDFSDDLRTAWFDERLDNAKWGRCRGSGVLVKRGKEWKIAQYNLTTPIPNDLLPEVAGRIKEFEAKPATAN